MKRTPQPGRRKRTARFSVLLLLLPLGAVLLYCACAALLRGLLPGQAAYVLALLAPAAAGWGAAVRIGAPADRQVHRLQEAFQTITDGDLSVRLPEEPGGMFSETYAGFNRMAQELQAVRARRDDYVNTLTHEFKTPLTAIRGFAELLQEPGFSEEEQKKYLRIIANESCQLSDLANDAMLLTKLDNQNLPVVNKTFWLDEQVSQCLVLLEGSAREKNQVLSAQIEPVEVCGSEELLSHVWSNLVSNAIKYTPDGASISVTLTQQGQDAVFTVSDTGIGMTEEVRSHIFDRYYQADPGHTRRGIGLGLPIVHSILNVCGGRIEVESTPNVGSTFRVHLPVKPAGHL